MRVCRYATLLLFAFLVNAANIIPPVIATNHAYAADEPWKVEFDQVCGSTDKAMDMTIDELKKSLARCDLLKPQIEQLEASPRKVYSKRLQQCRNLFAYMLESRNKAATQ